MNIKKTLNADEKLTKHAENKAMKNNTNLNSLFREWLSDYLKKTIVVENYKLLINSLHSVVSGIKFI